MLRVVALGGNALLRPGEGLELNSQVHRMDAATEALAALGSASQLVVTHGNGPQVGLLALQAESTPQVKPYPLDVLGAESEGLIGYLLDRSLVNRTERPVATLLTQTIVDGDDPAFDVPTKPIGPLYDEGGAQRLAVERGWSMAGDDGAYRRVVPSPDPRQIVELEAIRHLVAAGVTVVCCGGGGIPVTAGPEGALRGVEAVVDKDLASALLAVRLDADELILLTDVDGIFHDWGGPDERLIRSITPGQLRGFELPEGSMGPKAEACARFVEQTGGRAAIGRLEEAEKLIAGEVGTHVAAGAPGASGRVAE